jgi:Effector Associated Constant Component 1
MSTQIRIYLADNSDIDSLHSWLDGIPDISAESVPSPSGPGHQGDVWDFLSMLCGTGGAVTVGLNALTTWIESKATHARVVIGKVEVMLRGPDPEALARLVEAAKEAAQDGR